MHKTRLKLSLSLLCIQHIFHLFEVILKTQEIAFRVSKFTDQFIILVENLIIRGNAIQQRQI